MSFRSFMLRLFQNCNPAAYAELTDEKFSSSVRHFFQHFFILFIIMAVLFVPAYFFHADEVQTKLGSFTSANISGDFNSDGPVELLSAPRVVFDENATTVQGAQVVFGEGNIYYKPYYFFGKGTLSYSDIESLSTASPQFIALLALFILPSLVFWAGMYVLLKTLFLVVIFSFLGALIVGSFRHSLKFKHAFQVGLYAATPAMLIEMLLFPFWWSVWLPLFVYLLFFVIGVLLLSERKIHKHTSKA